MKNSSIKSSDELIKRAIEIALEGRKKTVVVPAAQDIDVIDAVVQAVDLGMLNVILVGDQTRIELLAKSENIKLDRMEIINEPEIDRAAHTAVKLASDKKADAIMKGFLPTSSLLKVVLDKQYGLRGNISLSHCAVLDIPKYHKLLNLTDGGMIVKPNKEQKLEILENAVTVGRALGLSPIKVALSASTNYVSSKIPHTITDADFVVPKAKEMFKDAEIDGPLPFDMATSKDSAEHRLLKGRVVGDADIFLFDSIEECNLMAKCLVQFARAVFCGVIVGAKVPVSLVSRTDTASNKKASLAMACLLADYYKQHKIWS